MKISRILPVAGILTLLACSAAFTQTPSIPPGAGVGAIARLRVLAGTIPRSLRTLILARQQGMASG
jgi:hypothetical protein